MTARSRLIAVVSRCRSVHDRYCDRARRWRASARGSHRPGRLLRRLRPAAEGRWSTRRRTRRSPTRRGGGRRGGFTQFTRPLASPDVLVRGKALYDTNCASCHAADLRGTVDGKNPNLLRSGIALAIRRVS